MADKTSSAIKLYDLAVHWDEMISDYIRKNEMFVIDPDGHKRHKKKEYEYQKMCDEIDFLGEIFFCDYELNKKKYIDALYEWLQQFDGYIDNEDDCEKSLKYEKRFMFLLAYKLIFFNRKQLLALQYEVWNKIKNMLCEDISFKEGKKILDVLWSEEQYRDLINKSVFTPLSDSGMLREFRQLLPEGASDTIIMNDIGKLIGPLKQFKIHNIREINDEYADMDTLYILEDFSGSGESVKNKIKKILEYYCFKKVVFCPLVITDTSFYELEKIKVYAYDIGKVYETLYGIRIGPECSVVSTNSSSNNMWSNEEKKALREISEKYYDLYFKNNGHLYMDYKEDNPVLPAKYGFKNGGMTIVLYRNCPNNSLPVIWEKSCGWKPLFIRHERHKKIKI